MVKGVWHCFALLCSRNLNAPIKVEEGITEMKVLPVQIKPNSKCIQTPAEMKKKQAVENNHEKSCKLFLYFSKFSSSERKSKQNNSNYSA